MKGFSCLILLTAVAMSVPAAGIEFGNIAIYPDSGTGEYIGDITIQLKGDSEIISFNENGELLIWNVHPGRNVLIFSVDNVTIIDNFQIDVYPGLTSKITICHKDGDFSIVDNGIADRAGHIITFSRDEIDNMPGDFAGRLSIFKSDKIKTGHKYLTTEFKLRDGSAGVFSITPPCEYSYDGLIYSSSLPQDGLAPIATLTPDMVLFSSSDPLAGYSNSEFSLISNFDGPSAIGLESVFGSYGRKYHHGKVRAKLPNDIGNIFGSYGLEDFDDASPRSNVGDILPHNSAKNSEFIGGAGIRLTSEINADFRMLYQKYKRDIYDHYYYYNLQHAPREEGYLYKGRLAIYGKLRQKIFYKVGVELGGDEYEKGDGLYFDNMTSYYRDDWPVGGNPDMDPTLLFWSWDDIYGETSNIDEGHIYDEYLHERTRQLKLDLALKKQIGDAAQITFDIDYISSNFRRYQNYHPTWGDTVNLENIGFDVTGRNLTNSNGFWDIPGPKQLNVSLGVNHLQSNYFITGVFDYLRFDPGTMALIDFINPFANGDPNLLDRSDLIPARVKSGTGYRFKGGFSLSPDISLFTNYSLQYCTPVFSYLYFGYDYFESSFNESAYQKLFANPNLELERRIIFELGAAWQQNYNNFIFSYRNEKYENLVTEVRLSGADPGMYSIFINADPVDDINNDLISATYQKAGEGFLRCALSFVMTDFDFDNSRISGITWFRPASWNVQMPATLKNILSRTTVDFSFIYKPGYRYNPWQEYYEPKTSYAVAIESLGFNYGGTGKKYLELNLGITLKLMDLSGFKFLVRGEVLNLLNTENHLRTYSATGQPDETGWLNTQDGEIFIENFNEPHDSTGLTGEEKYRVASNNPSNFGRPRMFRIMARLEF